MTRHPILHIRSGLHRGARAALEHGTEVTLGHADGCDLVLADTTLAAKHLSLRAEGRHLVVTAHDAAVEVPGAGRVEPGFRARLRRDTDLQVGDVVLHAQMPPTPVSAAGAGVALAAVAVMGAAAIFAIPDMRAAPVPVQSSELSLPPEAPAGLGPSEPGPPEATSTTPPVDRDMVAAEIETRLADIGFDHLDFDAGHETFALAGRVPADQRDVFQRFQAWFDETHPGLVMRTAGVTFPLHADPEVQPPAIESVWTMGQPYIVIGGRRYYSGDKVPNGWRLDGIEDDRAVFSDGGAVYRVALGETPGETVTPDPDTQLAAR